MTISHAHAATGFNDGAVYAFDSRVGVADQRKKGIQRERKNGEAIRACSDPGRGQQKSKECEARDCLNDVGGPQHGFVQRRPARDQNSQGDSDQHCKHGGHGHKPQMLEREFQNFCVVLQNKLPEVHKAPRLRSVPKAFTYAATIGSGECTN